MPTVTFRIRRDTSTNWSSVNPVLALGEPGLETDTKRVKYGDGSTAWNALGYTTVRWSEVTNRPTTLSGYGVTVSNADWLGTDLAIEHGGTGASNASTARANLGLGSIATRAAPTGTVVGTTDTQTLSGKTFSGATVFPGGAQVDASGYITSGGVNAWTMGNKPGVARIDYDGTAFRLLNQQDGFASFTAQQITLTGLPIYANNSDAAAGGLAAGRVYRTSTGQLMVRY